MPCSKVLGNRKYLTSDFSAFNWELGEKNSSNWENIYLNGHSTGNSNSSLFLELRLSGLKITEVMI